MDVATIRARLGMAPDSIAELTCTEYTPTSVSVPCFYPGEVDLAYADNKDLTFNSEPVVDIVCTVLTAEYAYDQEGQKLLDGYLASTGATSIKAAIESDKTLGGACGTLHCHHIDGYRLYTVGDNKYYGARFRVRIYPA